MKFIKSLSTIAIASPLVASIFIYILRQYISPHLSPLQKDLTGYTIVVTGGCHGIGYEISNILITKNNARIIAGCRNSSKYFEQFTKNLNSEILSRLSIYELDLRSFGSVYNFSSQVYKNHTSVNMLINNAGIRHNHLEYSQNNIETHFQVNHLSHFLLTKLLLPLLIRSSSLFKSRIIHVSSSAHSFGYIDRDIYDISSKKFSEQIFHSIQKKRLEGIYGDTKLMQVISSYLLQYKLQQNYELSEIFNYHDTKYKALLGELDSYRNLSLKSKVLSVSVHPGFVNSNMGHADNRWMQSFILFLRPLLSRSVTQGALAVICTIDPSYNYTSSNNYIDNCKTTESSVDKMNFISFDNLLESAEWLWNISQLIIDSSF